VKAETFPFDRPQLRSERADDKRVPGKPAGVKAKAGPGGVRLTWTAPAGGAEDYAIVRNGGAVGYSTDTSFTDETAKPGMVYLYQVAARGVSARPSGSAMAIAATEFAWLWGIGGLALIGGGAALWRKKGRRA
jgi:hypothetical protein